LNNNTTFLTRSTVDTKDTITLDGVEYLWLKFIFLAARTHFFTGEERIVDVEGRVDKFKERRAAAQKAREAKVSAKKP